MMVLKYLFASFELKPYNYVQHLHRGVMQRARR